jgi:proteasome accessory factor C
VGEATIEELAERFGMDQQGIVAELELAACCGLPPYTPDQLLELVVDDERVVAYGLEALSRPARFTPDEGFALAAAARALLAVPGAEGEASLKSALGKLEGALGNGKVSVELAIPANLGVLQRAAATGELIEISYLGAKRGDETVRVVSPHAVVAREGQFYLDGFCHLAGDWRRFQVGRIASVKALGRHDEVRTAPPELSGPRAFAGGKTVLIAHVAMPMGRAVLIERFAEGPAVQAPTGRLVVPVAVADEYWFGRLMLRLGEDAEVLDPPELKGARAKAARRALGRYEEVSTVSSTGSTTRPSVGAGPGASRRSR